MSAENPNNWWRTIETAPKDGTWFLARYDSEFGPPMGAMRWEIELPEKKRAFYSASILSEREKATGWMPLPLPPEEAK